LLQYMKYGYFILESVLVPDMYWVYAYDTFWIRIDDILILYFIFFATGTRVTLLWYMCGTRIQKNVFIFLFLLFAFFIYRRFMFFVCYSLMINIILFKQIFIYSREREILIFIMKEHKKYAILVEINEIYLM
jgi:hypothetical protein